MTEGLEQVVWQTPLASVPAWPASGKQRLTYTSQLWLHSATGSSPPLLMPLLLPPQVSTKGAATSARTNGQAGRLRKAIIAYLLLNVGGTDTQHRDSNLCRQARVRPRHSGFGDGRGDARLAPLGHAVATLTRPVAPAADLARHQVLHPVCRQIDGRVQVLLDLL